VVFKFLSRFAFSKRERENGDPLASALALLDRRRYEEATAALDALIAAGGTRNAFLFNKRGVAKAELGRTDEARRDFEWALSVQPKFAPALVNLGNLALEADLVVEAIERYEAAIAVDPEYPGAHFNASVAYKRLGRYADAVRALRTAQKLEGRAQRKPRTAP